MFAKKLMAFVSTDSICSWVVVWTGDSLNQLSNADFDFFKSFYGVDKLSFSSEYVYDSDDEQFNHCFDDLYEDYYD